MKNIIFLKKNCPPEPLRANRNYPAVPAGLSLPSSIKWILVSSRGLRAAALSHTTVRTCRFCLVNIMSDSRCSLLCLYLAVLPARGEAHGSLVRHLVKKQANATGSPWSTNTRIPAKHPCSWDPQTCPSTLLTLWGEEEEMWEIKPQRKRRELYDCTLTASTWEAEQTPLSTTEMLLTLQQTRVCESPTSLIRNKGFSQEGLTFFCSPGS